MTVVCRQQLVKQLLGSIYGEMLTFPLHFFLGMTISLPLELYSIM